MKKTLLPLTPLLAAYALRGAKTSATFFSLFLLSGALFLFASRRWRPRPVPLSLIFPFLLFLLWCLAPLFGIAPLDIHLFYFSRACLYVMAGLLIYQFADAGLIAAFEKTLIALGCVEALHIMAASALDRALDTQYAGYLGNPLHSGILMPAAFAVALAKTKHAVQPRDRVWAWLAAALLAVAVCLIRSRAGILCLGVLLLYMYFEKAPRVMLGIACVAAIIVAIRGQALLNYLQIDAHGIHSTTGRFGIWITALDAIRSRPLTGFGLGNFETAYFLFQQPGNEALRYSKWTMFAHNGFLQIAAEAGLPALVLLLWGYLAAIKKALPSFLKERTLFSILIVFLITSLFNYSLFLPFNGLLFATALALLASKISVDGKTIELAKRPLIPAFVICLLSFFLASYASSEWLQSKGRAMPAARVCPIRSEAWYQVGLEKLAAQENALPFFKSALVWNPENGFYWHRMALALIDLQPAGENEIDRCFKRAQQLAPYHAPFAVQEGFYRLRKSQWEAARVLFTKASELEPTAPVPHMGLAWSYRGQGNKQAAQSEFDLANALKSRQLQLAADPAHGLQNRSFFQSNYGRVLFELERN